VSGGRQESRSAPPRLGWSYQDANADGLSDMVHGGSGQAWAYTTRTFAALDHHFVVNTTDEQFGRLIDHLYAACSSPEDPRTHYSVVEEPIGTPERSLFIDGQRVASVSRPSWLLRFLAWQINHRVIADSSRHVLLHAASVARGANGVILAGPPDAGKTTLAAGLVRAGLAYLTDEATAIDPRTLRLVPYPKPLSLDAGSLALLRPVSMYAEGVAGGYFDDQWQIPADDLRAHAVGDLANPTVVVFPRYEVGAETRVRRLRAAESLARLTRFTFGFLDRAPLNLRVLGRVLEQAPAYELVSGDLDSACSAVLRTLDQDGETG
jgi:hypothetical protein